MGCSPWGHKESAMTERLTLTYTYSGPSKLTDRSLIGRMPPSIWVCLMFFSWSEWAYGDVPSSAHRSLFFKKFIFGPTV